MFKNLQLFKIVTAPSLVDIGTTLETAAFLPCGASQEKSVGWVPPRGGEHDEYAPSVGGHTILKLTTEVKVVPGDVLRRKVDEQVAHIEETTGRKPGKKERREIKDDARLAMLPLAFAKRSATLIWVNVKDSYIAIDASSQSKADEAITMLIKAFDGLALQLVNTQQSPGTSMAQWLTNSDNLPEKFSIDRQCELRAFDESKARVKYANHSLDIEEIREHIAMGKMPINLSMTWNERVSFTLTEGLTLKKLAFLNVCFEDSASKGDNAEDHFDADVAIATGELSKLVPDLLAALGGEVVNAKPLTEHGAEVDDPLYQQAVDLVKKHKKASISLVQRHLQIGYNRAARLLESMEAAGLITPMQSNGARELVVGAC